MIRSASVTAVFLIAALIHGTAAGDGASPAVLASPYGNAALVGSITNPAIKEASGLAHSLAAKGILWVLNDSHNTATLFAVTTNGSTVGEVRLEGAQNRDWEDLASFRLDGRPYLLIADVGDNEARWDTCTLFVVTDPLCDAPDRVLPETVPVARTIEFRYSDGPRDCEAVAVDVPGDRILLLSKTTTPPVLYELPLRNTGAATVLEAKRIAELRTIPPPTAEDLRGRYGKYRSQPTAMDLMLGGTGMIVLTYKHAYLYHRAEGGDWEEAFWERPQTLILPDPRTGIMRQRESLCIDPETHVVTVTSEGSPSPLYRQAPRPGAVPGRTATSMGRRR